MADDLEERQGDWLQTFTGKRFYVFDPRPEEVDLFDIANALSMQCRFGGHSRYFYSIAEHSVLLAWHAYKETKDKGVAFAALMHDSPEAYLPDLVRPIKLGMPEYKAVERKIEQVIIQKYKIDPEALKLIKQWDGRILMDEREVLFTKNQRWENEPEPLGVTLKCWDPRTANAYFQDQFMRFKPKGV